MASPPFRVVLLLLVRMLGQSPLVYWDIQTGNPFAAQARTTLSGCLSEILRICAPSGAYGDFQAALAELAALGTSSHTLASASNDFLAAVSRIEL